MFGANLGEPTTARVTKVPDYTWREQSTGTVGGLGGNGNAKEESPIRSRVQPIPTSLFSRFISPQSGVFPFSYRMGSGLDQPLITKNKIGVVTIFESEFMSGWVRPASVPSRRGASHL